MALQGSFFAQLAVYKIKGNSLPEVFPATVGKKSCWDAGINILPSLLYLSLILESDSPVFSASGTEDAQHQARLALHLFQQASHLPWAPPSFQAFTALPSWNISEISEM